MFASAEGPAKELAGDIKEMKEAMKDLQKRQGLVELAIDDHAKLIKEGLHRIYGGEGYVSLVEEVEDHLLKFRKELLTQRNQMTELNSKCVRIADALGLLKKEYTSFKQNGGGAGGGNVREQVDAHLADSLARFDSKMLQVEQNTEAFRLEVLSLLERWQGTFVSIDQMRRILSDETKEFSLVAEQAVIKAGFIAITCTDCTVPQRMDMFDMLLLKEKQLQDARMAAAAEYDKMIEDIEGDFGSEEDWPPEHSFMVTVEKTEQAGLGLLVDPDRERQAAVISQVSPGGLIAEWNEKNPTMAISPGDVIVGANFHTSYLDIILELQKQQEIEMAILTHDRAAVVFAPSQDSLP